MARAPAFDREAVRDAASMLFWRRGFAAGTGGLYAAFGDERGLVDAVLAHYRARSFAPLAAEEAGLDVSGAVVPRPARRDPIAPAPRWLVTNAACKLGLSDDLVRAGLKDVLDDVAERLKGVGVLARPGEPPERLDRPVRTAPAPLRAADPDPRAERTRSWPN
jgi:AcrR family transcriptional regulator